MRETCFVVDDEPIEVQFLESILTTNFPDLSVYKATGGRKLLELLDTHKPDILIIDIQIPGMNGFELIEIVKEYFPKVRILVVSAYEYFEYAQRALDIGVKKYLVKPASRVEITKSVELLLQEIRNEKKVLSEHVIQKERVELTDLYLKKEFLKGIIHQAIDPTEFEVISKLISNNSYEGIIVIIHFTDSEKPARRFDFQTVWGSKYPVIIEDWYNQMQVCLLMYESSNDCLNQRELLYKELAHFKEKHFLEGMVWGIGHAACHLEEYFSSFREALSNVQGYDFLKYKVEKYIKENYKRELSLEDVAKDANFSVHYFSKWFKKFFNKTFSEYVIDLRMGEAMQLLKDTNLTIKEISYRIGFNDPNYFSKLFKKMVGKNPTEFHHSKEIK